MLQVPEAPSVVAFRQPRGEELFERAIGDRLAIGASCVAQVFFGIVDFHLQLELLLLQVREALVGGRRILASGWPCARNS